MPEEHPFASLVRAITYQQLAGRAAAAIHGRLVASVGGQVVPERVLGLSETDFRTAGLSGAKTRSILDLAAKVADGTAPLDRLDDLGDEEIIERLSTVRGIGRWTAEMFLIFQLRRRDIWPVEDFGVRKGYAAIHHLTAAPTPRALRDLGEIYRPWRTVAAWYCWRAAETVVPQA
jgi:DNA-3-methyladenine glycosylase II